MIEFTLSGVLVPGLDPEFFILWLTEVARNEGCSIVALNVVFKSDEDLLEMNQQYLNHDYYTDIITFDYSEGKELSGDLFISIDRVIENAKNLNQDYDAELKRVCVHGLLHLCGFKDKSISEEKIMRQKEDYYLSRYVSRET